MTEYRVDLQRYEYTAPAEGVRILRKFIIRTDGRPMSTAKRRPIFVPITCCGRSRCQAGNHTVEFRFRAPHYAALTAVTRACSLLLLAGLVAAVSVAAVRKRKQTENS